MKMFNLSGKENHLFPASKAFSSYAVMAAGNGWLRFAVFLTP